MAASKWDVRIGTVAGDVAYVGDAAVRAPVSNTCTSFRLAVESFPPKKMMDLQHRHRVGTPVCGLGDAFHKPASPHRSMVCAVWHSRGDGAPAASLVAN